MKIRFELDMYIYTLCIFVLVSILFIFNLPDPRTHTADSLRDIRWEIVGSVPNQTPAILLDCDRVESCFSKDLYPDRYNLTESNKEIYVWSYKYQRPDLADPTTVLYIVVNRPTEKTWDIIGLEYVYGKWQTGIYSGHGTNYVGPSNTPKWLTETITLSPSFDNQTIAIGMATEPWGVLVRPTSQTTFSYSVVEYYWK